MSVGLVGTPDRREGPQSGPSGLDPNHFTENTQFLYRSGLLSRKARKAGPAMSAAELKSWGRFAPLSDRSGAPARPLRGTVYAVAARCLANRKHKKTGPSEPVFHNAMPINR